MLFDFVDVKLFTKYQRMNKMCGRIGCEKGMLLSLDRLGIDIHAGIRFGAALLHNVWVWMHFSSRELWCKFRFTDFSGMPSSFGPWCQRLREFLFIFIQHIIDQRSNEHQITPRCNSILQHSFRWCTQLYHKATAVLCETIMAASLVIKHIYTYCCDTLSSKYILIRFNYSTTKWAFNLIAQNFLHKTRICKIAMAFSHMPSIFIHIVFLWYV